MNYVLVIKANGTKVRYPATPDKVVPAEPGDEIILVDVNGNPVEASLTPNEEDLIVGFEDGTKVTIDDFYGAEEGADPVTIGIKPPVEESFQEYEFNSQIGNLPGDGDFTLMRFSSTDFIGFDAPSGKAGVLGDYAIPKGLGFASDGPPPVTPLPDSIGVEQPVAAPDSALTDENSPVNVNLLANDSGPGGTAVTLFAIQGIEVSAGDTITLYSGAVVTVNADGTVLYSPGDAFDSLGPGESVTESFDYTIIDADGNLADSTATVTINGVNDAPEASDDFAQGLEDVPIFNIPILSNDSDPDGDALTLVGVPTATNGSVTVNPDGTITYIPNQNFNGVDTVTYTVTDPSGETSTATLEVMVVAVNDAPVAVDDSGSGDEDNVITGNVISNDTDVDGDTPLTVVSNTDPANGTVVVAADGSYTYTPNADFNGTDSFTYVMQDPSGATDTATVTLTVNPVNDPPMGVDDFATTDEDAPIYNLNVLGNDTDPDGDTLSVQGTPTAGNGTVAVNPDGTLNYTPDPNFNGTDTITYVVTDGNGQSDTATVTVTVNAVNDAPVAVDDSGSGNEDTAITGNVITNDTDVDGDTPLTVVSNTNPANGSVVVAADGSYTYTPNANFNGTDSFTYVMQDPSGATDTATVTLTVNPVNDPPVGVDDFATTDEDAPIYNLDVLGNDTDPDGDTLSVQGTPTAGNGTVAVNPDGTLNYTPDPNFNGTDTITYIVTDGNGQSDTATVTVTVNAVNDAPVAVDDSGSGNEDTAITGNVITNDTDVDGDTPLTVVSNTDPANGTLVVAADGSYTYTPNADFNGTDNFTYVMQDPSGATDTATVTLTVNPVNDPPVGVDEFATTDEDAPIYNLDVLGNDTDPDGDTLSVQGTPTAGNGTVAVNPDGTLNYTPDPNFNGTDTITYIVTDGNGQSDTATVTVTVNAVNDAPVAVDDSGSGNEDTAITGNVITNDTDVDGDTPLTVLSNTNPSNGTLVVAADGSYTYTPNADFNGTDSFTYVMQDPSGATDTATVTLTVNPVNDPPVGVDEFATTDEDAPIYNLDVLGNDTDPDGDTLSVQGTPTAGNGTVAVNPDGTLNYTPDPNFNGTDTITYIVTDGNGASDTATVTVTVNPINDAPDAKDDTGSGNEDNAITGNVITNDTDVDGDTPLTVLSNTTPAHGTLVIAPDGSYTYTPDANFNGTDSFTYVMQDPSGATDTATVTLTVNPVNDNPVAVNDSLSVAEDSGVAITAVDGVIDPNDTDVDGDTLMVSAFRTGPEAGIGVPGTVGMPLSGNLGTLKLLADGSFDYTADQPAADALAVGESAVDTFTYTVSDGAGGTDTAQIDVVVTGTNDGPVAVNDTGAVNEDATLVVNAAGGVLSNDTDLDTSDTLEVTAIRTGTEGGSGTGTLVGNALVGTYGTLTLNADGSYSYAADQDAANALPVGQMVTDTFTYTISDGNGGTDTAELEITVTGTNDAPLPNPPGGTPGVDPGVYDDTDTVAEDAPAPTTGNVLANDSDPDGDTLTVSSIDGNAVSAMTPGVVVGTYGTITQNADGTYSYALDNGNADVQALAVGETTTETFTYTANDGNGGTASADLVITITGTNDVPVANPPMGTPGVDFGVYDDADSISEDAFPNNVTGNVLSNDLDPDGDTLTVSAVNGSGANTGSAVAGTYGTITINSDGTYNYQLDNGNPTIQALGVGQSTTDTFTYTANDGNGGTATATLTITINGTNDAPLPNPPGGTPGVDFGVYDDTDTVAEDAPAPATGNVLANDSDPDGDTLTVSSIDGNAVSAMTPGVVVGTYGTITQNADGTYSYALDNGNADVQALAVGETTTETFTYTANDGNGGSASADLVITITGTNDVPVANPPMGTPGVDFGVYDDTNSVTEDFPAPVIGNVISNDLDPDGDTLTVSAVNGVAGNVDSALAGTYGTITINEDGSYSYALDNSNPTVQALGVGQSTTETFNYTASDGNGGTATATLTITINGTNDGPVAVDDTASGNEDNAITGNVLTNDTDIDGDTPLTVVSNTNPSNGTVVVAADGSYTYTPDADFNGTDSFTYVMQDPSGATDTATVTLTVNPVNDPPVGVDDVATTDEDAPIYNLDVLGNDTDPDGDTLSVQGTPTAGNGTVAVNPDGTLNYTPDPNFNGTDTITYVVTDGNGQSDTATVTVTVNAVNDAPVAVDDSGSGNEDTAITGNVITNDTDVDGDTPLTVVSNTDPANGTLVIAANGAYTYTPNADFNGTDSFTYVMQDPSGATDTATVTLTVNPVNDPPVGVDDVATTDEDAPIYNLDVLGNDTDPDGDTLSVQGTPTAGNGTVAVNPDGTLNYTPDPNFNGTDTITYIVTDGNGQSDTATVTVTVNAVNDAPVAVDDSGSGNEDTAITGNVITNDTDVDGDTPLTVVSNTNPSNGTVVVAANGSYTYTPNADFNGTDSFTYVMQDPSGATDTATVTLTVNPVNDPPVGVDDVATTNEDAPIYNLNVLGNDTDPDGDTLSVQGTPTAGNGTVTVNPDGTLNYTPDPNFNGTDTITYVVTDGNGQSDTATVTVTVNAVNDAPVAVDDAGSGNEDTAITGNVIANDTDVDGDTPLTVVSNTDPSNGTLVIAANGAYTYTPDADFNGTDSFTYVMQDPSGATDTATVTLTVNPVNDPPVGVDDVATTDEDAPIYNLDVLGNDTDPDGDTLSVQGTPTAGNGTVAVNPDGTLNYTPDPNFNGTDTITYVVTDGNGQSDTATVTVTVNAVNDAPVANDDSGSGNEDTAITGNVITNDTDVDGDTPLTVVSNTNPSNGTVVVAADGSYTYTPNADFNGTDSFTYVMQDPSGATDTATVTLTVNPVNDPPVGVDDFATTDEDAPIYNLNVLGNDTDPDGDTLSVQGTPTAGNGTVAVNPDGTLNYTPDPNFNGTDTITYVVTDGNGQSDTATVTVTVNAVNDAPVAVDDSGSGNEDTAITGNVITNDTDVDGDTPLTVVSNTDPANGTVVVAADGSYTYTPNADFNGTDSFTYVMQDPSGATDTATVTLTVNPVNDPPVGVDDVATTNEDAPIYNLNVLGNDTDPDGDTLSVQGTPTAPNGTVAVNPDGTLNYTPDPNFNGTDTITYVVTDGNGQSDTATVTVTVNAVNDAPVANDDSGSGNEDTAITGNVITNDTDVDGDSPLTVVSNTNPSNGTLVIAANGAYTYTPNADFNGTDSFTYVMQDPSGATDTATVTLTVNPTSDPPVGVDDVATTDEDTAIFNFDVLGNDTDPDGDTLSVQGTPTAGNGTVTVNPDGTLNYVPDPNFNGTDTITYVVTDGNGASDTATVTVTVNPVNDPPVGNPDTAGTNKNVPVNNIDVLGNDTDVEGDMLSVSGTPTATNGSVTVNPDGTINYTPNTDFVGEDTITYVVSDGNGGSATSTVTVTVNDPPNAVDDAVTTDEDMPLTNIDVLGNDSDSDGGVLAVVGVPTASNGVVTKNPDGTLNYTPDPNFNGTDTVTYVVEDGQGGSSTATLTITVNPVNDAPEANNDMGSGDEDNAITGNVIGNDTDVDGDSPLTVVSNTNPSNGTLVIAANGAYTYTPDANFNGTDSFTYVMQDPSGATDTATVTLTVNPVNDAPEANDDAGSADEDNDITGNVITNDTDVDGDTPLTVLSNTNPSNGTLVIAANGAYTYTPNANFNGTDSFTYVVQDPSGATDTATVTLTVNSVNDAPVAGDDTISYTENAGSATGNNLLLNDTDPDAGATQTILTVNGSSMNVGNPIATTYGALTINSDGTFSFVENAAINQLNDGQTVTETLTYLISDGLGGSDTATVDFVITGVNDDPNATGTIANIEVPEPPTIVNTPPSAGTAVDTDDLDDQTVTQIANQLLGDGVVLQSATVTSGTNDQIGTITDMLTSMPGVTGFDDGVILTTGTVESIGGPNSSDGFSAGGAGAVADPDLGTVFDLAILRIEFIPTGNIISGNYIFGSEEYNEFVNQGFNDNTGIIVNGTNVALTPDNNIIGIDTVNSGANSGLYVDNDIQDTGAPYATEMDGFTRTLQFSANVTPGVVNVLEIKIGDVGDADWDSWVVLQANSVMSNGVNIDVATYFDDIDFEDDPSSLTYTVTQVGGAAIPGWLNLSGTNLTGFAPTDGSVDLNLEVTATDSQGATASTTFKIQSTGNVAPVVIDLDGDGAEFTSLEDGVQFDVDGDGVKEQVAWAAKDDALLVYDKDDDGNITDTDEVAFTGYVEGAETDLEGLRAFDTDDDGLLDTDDAEWERFHLWQDADGDGVVDEGELTSLDEHGIESIGLVSDGESYSAADGDVFVHGESDVTYADGTTGIAADSEFSYEELIDQSGDGPLEVISDSGEVVNLDEAGRGDALGSAAEGDEIIVPEGSPTSSIDEQAANDAAMQ